MFIVFENVDNNEIRKHIKALNRTGLLDRKLMLHPNMRKNDLTTVFIKGIEACHDSNVLDDVPDEIFDYYTSIVLPDKKAKPEKSTPETPKPVQQSLLENIPTANQEAIEPCESILSTKDDTLDVKIDSSPSDSVEVEATILDSSTKQDSEYPVDNLSDIEYKLRISNKNKGDTKTRKTKVSEADVVSRRKSKIGKKKKVRRSKLKKDGKTELAITDKKIRTDTEGKKSKVGKTNKKKRKADSLEEDEISRCAKTQKFTRAKVMADIVLEKKPRTKRQIVAEMQKQYGGSNKEAFYWVGGYCSLLIAMDLMVKRSDGRFVYQK